MIIKKEVLNGPVVLENGEEWHFKDGKPIAIYGPKDSYKCIIYYPDYKKAKVKAS